MRQDEASDDDEQSGENDRRSIAEWTTLIVSALFVAALVGAALYEHFAREEPPGVRIAVELALDEADVRGGLTYIPFTVVNTGADPAESVVVLFEIKQGEETVEESTAEIAFLPNSGSADGELVTALDLGTHTIEARVATLLFP
jgi:uncharacterized protein (TIGR02588 family)